ncbi:MAG: peptide chain release factor N(5)-glutamine methyltransferase [Magnetococcus sp. DMHC-6]
MPPVWTIRRLRQWHTEWLGKQGIETPQLDGDLLLAKALGVTRLQLFLDPERPLTPQELSEFKQLLRRRALREPVALILQQRSFRHLEFKLRPGVLIPRPETEHLVEAVLERFPDHEAPLRILDVGVGSGAILLTLLTLYPQAVGTGIDISEVALSCTQENATIFGIESNRVHLLQGNLFNNLPPPPETTPFHLIVANPPYIKRSEFNELALEILNWEPREALFGGEDGLDIYTRLIPQAVDYLVTEGFCAVEIGHTQSPAVEELFQKAGLQKVQTLQDYNRHPRVVLGWRPPL